MPEYIEREKLLNKLTEDAKSYLEDNSIQCSIAAGVVCSIKEEVAKMPCVYMHEQNDKRTAIKPVEKFPFHHCPSCNTVVSEHNKFCSECGQKLDWRDLND